VIAGIVVGLGGLLFGGVLAPALPVLRILLPVAGLVGAVSLVDDWRGLSPGVRLVVHVVAACVLVLVPGDPIGWGRLGALASAGAVVSLVWTTNLYNFMDGMDGFAGGMSVIGFTTLGVAAARHGSSDIAFLCFAVAAAAGGFLIFNFPPARIFLGDVGSSVLGFLGGALSLWGTARGAFPWWVALLGFSAFVVDATVTVLRRAIAAERIWTPHRSHFYQRLVRLGWSHRRTVLTEYALMLAASGSALTVMEWRGAVWPALLAAWAALFAGLALAVRWLETRAVRVSDPRGVAS
jgi:UDP-N-acetylmuramyl pentapeptide phosphotransferase/UDP-N-acetylglucosamine-1-phosphate transferase